MKKRMLITAIVMVVVLAVALTTSSLAWFSATQSNVTASGGSFTASTATGSGVNIAISNDMVSFKSKINLDKLDTALIPMCVNTSLTTSLEGTDLSKQVMLDTAEVNNNYFKESTINTCDVKLDYTDGNRVIASTLASTKHYYYDAIYLVNYDQSNTLDSITLNLSGNISHEAGSKATEYATPVSLIRVSRSGNGENWSQVNFFVVVLDGSNAYTVYDLRSLDGSADYSEDLLTAKATTSIENIHSTVATKAEGFMTFEANEMVFDFSNGGEGTGLAAGGTEFAKIDILMWFDGNGLNSNSQQTKVEFNVEIKGPDNA